MFLSENPDFSWERGRGSRKKRGTGTPKNVKGEEARIGKKEARTSLPTMYINTLLRR